MLKPNSKVTTTLIKARELIADEKNWCQHAVFDGDRMCALGALQVAIFGAGISHMPVMHPTVKLLRSAGGMDPWEVNDNLGHVAVMAMFDRAIELSLQEQGESQ